MGLFSFIKDKLTGKVATGEEIRQKIIANGYAIQRLMVVTDSTTGKDVAAVYGFVPDQATREKIVVEVGNMPGIDQVEDRMTLGNPPMAAPAAPAPAVAAAAGAVPAPAVPAAAPPAGPRPPLAAGQFTESRSYTVKSGDTLSKIAKETLGNASRYNEIFEINQPMLKHPDKIYPGQVLRIPKA